MDIKFTYEETYPNDHQVQLIGTAKFEFEGKPQEAVMAMMCLKEAYDKKKMQEEMATTLTKQIDKFTSIK